MKQIVEYFEKEIPLAEIGFEDYGVRKYMTVKYLGKAHIECVYPNLEVEEIIQRLHRWCTNVYEENRLDLLTTPRRDYFDRMCEDSSRPDFACFYPWFFERFGSWEALELAAKKTGIEGIISVEHNYERVLYSMLDYPVLTIEDTITCYEKDQWEKARQDLAHGRRKK